MYKNINDLLRSNFKHNIPSVTITAFQTTEPTPPPLTEDYLFPEIGRNIVGVPAVWVRGGWVRVQDYAKNLLRKSILKNAFKYLNLALFFSLAMLTHCF